jgi:dTDP-glucose 4,6-dehydratase
MHATDHARAIETLLQWGIPGQAYNLAAEDEHNDLEIATRIAEICTGQPQGIDPSTLPIVYQPGRPGHDKRYAMDGSQLRLLGWKRLVPFDEGFEQTVRWTMSHSDYWEHDLVEVG